jgi:signal transduction histidine kinase
MISAEASLVQAQRRCESETNALSALVEEIAETVQRGAEGRGEVVSMLDATLSQCDAAIAVLSRVARGRIRARWTTVAVRDLLDTLIHTLRPFWPLRVYVKNRIPAGFLVPTIREVLLSALENLLNNAVAAATRFGGQVTISARTDREGSAYLVEIANLGEIRPEQMASIEDGMPVPRGDGSYGIGLLITHGDLQQIGGHLLMENVAGTGSLEDWVRTTIVLRA